MSVQINQNSISFQPVPLGKRMMEGAVVAATILFCFLFASGEPNPLWGKFWVFKPLTIVSLAGAASAAYYYFMDQLRKRGGWRKRFADISSLLVFLILLWMGTVLGLDGTMWH